MRAQTCCCYLFGDEENKMEIKIDKEFKKLIPPIDYEEFSGLEESLKKEGCRDPLITWNNILLDGHNRYKVCRAYNIEFKTKELNFESREKAILWIINNQLGRRNIISFDRINLEFTKKSLITGKSVSLMTRDMRKEIAKSTGTSEGLIAQVKRIHEVLSPVEIQEVREKINKNKETIGSIYRKIINKEKEEKRKELRKEKISKSKIKPKLEILEGDFFEKIKSIKREYNLIYVDPPYNILKEDWDKFNEKEFQEFTEKWINAILPKLKEDGRLYVNFSQEFMFKFHEWIKPFLKKYDMVLGNVIIWNYKNNMKPHDKKQYKYSYEPIFYYRKKKAGNLIDLEDYGEERQDVWTIATPQSNYNKDKKEHPAQKPQELLRRIILTGSKPGDWILDGFAGAGTTGIVALENERNVTLIEKDKKYLKIIKENLK